MRALAAVALLATATTMLPDAIRAQQSDDRRRCLASEGVTPERKLESCTAAIKSGGQTAQCYDGHHAITAVGKFGRADLAGGNGRGRAGVTRRGGSGLRSWCRCRTHAIVHCHELRGGMRWYLVVRGTGASNSATKVGHADSTTADRVGHYTVWTRLDAWSFW